VPARVSSDWTPPLCAVGLPVTAAQTTAWQAPVGYGQRMNIVASSANGTLFRTQALGQPDNFHSAQQIVEVDAAGNVLRSLCNDNGFGARSGVYSVDPVSGRLFYAASRTSADLFLWDPATPNAPTHLYSMGPPASA
jgi:hypothetical protein